MQSTRCDRSTETGAKSEERCHLPRLSLRNIQIKEDVHMLRSSGNNSSNESASSCGLLSTTRSSSIPMADDEHKSELLSILDSILFFNKWVLISRLSLRPDCGVFLVSVDTHVPTHRVIRLTRESSNHCAYEFVSFWANRNCPYLPQMEECEFVCLDDEATEESDDDTDDFVLENYEFIPFQNDQPCDLFAFLNLPNDQVNDMKYRYMLDVVRGIKFLVDENWCHGDLSVENVVCGGTTAKLIDFESSLQYDPTTAYPASSFGPTKPLYRPPELDFDDLLFYPSQIDVWSVGVMLFVAATKQFPFEETGEERDRQFEFIRRNGFKQFVDVYFEEHLLDDLLFDLLDRIFIVFDLVDCGEGFFECRPKLRWRLTPDGILEHPFFAPYL